MQTSGRKGQISIEFTILLGFMLFIFVMMFAAIQQQNIEIQQRVTQQKAQEILNVVRSEIDMARTAPEGYKKRFLLPDEINGDNYELKLKNQTELVVRYKDRVALYFLDKKVMGGINDQKGYHIVRRLPNGTITIRPDY